MYERPIDPREIAPFGLTLEDFAGDPVEIWPEHRPAFEAFVAMGTQWRIGMAGPTGLDYNVLLPLLNRMDLSKDAWDDTFEAVRVMEHEALQVMREAK